MEETKALGHWAWIGPPPRYKGDPQEGPSIWVPDIEITTLGPEDKLEPMRGYASVVAVMRDHKCIGWTKQ